MNIIISMILASLPKIALIIAGKLLSEKFLQALIEDLIIYALRKGAKLSVTPYDDEMVEKMAVQIKGGGDVAG